MKTYMAKKGSVAQAWWVVDATDKVLGRLAVNLATVLSGKNKPIYTPHVDTGEFIVVVNAEKVRVTGRKMDHKEYKTYSGYPGGLKLEPMRRVLARHPDRVIRTAVARMLPKGALGNAMLRKLKIYSGPDHPHGAQNPKELKLTGKRIAV